MTTCTHCQAAVSVPDADRPWICSHCRGMNAGHKPMADTRVTVVLTNADRAFLANFRDGVVVPHPYEARLLGLIEALTGERWLPDGDARTERDDCAHPEAKALPSYYSDTEWCPDCGAARGTDGNYGPGSKMLEWQFPRTRYQTTPPAGKVPMRTQDGRTVLIGTEAQWDTRWETLFAGSVAGMAPALARACPPASTPAEKRLAASHLASLAKWLANEGLRCEMMRAAERAPREESE